jgi:hypothetical protein
VEEGLGLAQALEALRDELELAWRSGQGRAVRFKASEVTLTLTTVARFDKDGSGRIRWYVIDVGGRVSSRNERKNTLTLTMKPEHVDAAGRSTPLAVSGLESDPGR